MPFGDWKPSSLCKVITRGQVTQTAGSGTFNFTQLLSPINKPDTSLIPAMTVATANIVTTVSTTTFLMVMVVTAGTGVSVMVLRRPAERIRRWCGMRMWSSVQSQEVPVRVPLEIIYVFKPLNISLSSSLTPFWEQYKHSHPSSRKKVKPFWSNYRKTVGTQFWNRDTIIWSFQHGLCIN